MTDTPTQDLTGQQFGKWTVISYAGKNRKTSHVTDMWLCRCACGLEKEIPKHNLLRKRSTQCKSCQGKASRIEKHVDRSRYGCWSRTVQHDCVPEWSSYPAFAKWAEGRCGRYITKRRADQPYGPDNAYFGEQHPSVIDSNERLVKALVAEGSTEAMARHRLALTSRQMRHKLLKSLVYKECLRCAKPIYRASLCEEHYAAAAPSGQRKYIDAFGKSKTAWEWSKEKSVKDKGITWKVIKRRIEQGMDPEQAVSTPVRRRKTKKCPK